ncbi:hypothetical protein XH88_27855 [Bradyrhizobium sp. CCBAU 51627]|nr:hypothetical protein [Bradyrhizobium sp. CCBAU 51627]
MGSAARADGGAGGIGGGAGGGGGTTNLTTTGGTGGDGSIRGGGGGGGAGATGGGGGTGGILDLGGMGGASAGASGATGTVDFSGGTGGGGGGGGAHGAVVSATTTNSGAIAGGAGGRGGASLANAGGGGGGAGGYGVVVNGSGLIYTNRGTATGGIGGDGGITSGGGNSGGNGGDGGVGVAFTGSGTLVNSGTVAGASGGAGGAGSSGATAGTAGTGGAGIVGAGLTIINSGSITGGLSGDGVTRANAISFTGGSNMLELQAGSTITGNVVGTGTDTLRLGGSSNASFDVSNIGASAQYQGFSTFVKTGSSTWTLSGTTTTTTPWIINQGTLLLSSAGALGAASGTTTVSGGTLDLGGTTQTQAVVNLTGGTIQNGGLNAAIVSTGGTIGGIGGTASLTTTGGTTIVTGTNTYSGATTVNGGVLEVDGSITDPTVNSGGTLSGTGSVGATQINAGGTFAPGNGTAGSSMTVAGSLVFQSGAIYLVQVNPSTASFASVTGSATLNGASVNAVFANGSYVSKQYTILTANSVGGTFGSLASTNLPTNFSSSLSYDATHAYLNLTLNFTPSPPPNFGNGLSGNQQAIGNALVGFFNATGGIPLVYGTLNASGLTQASGEAATGSQQTTFNAMGQFMGLLTDPFMQRSGGAGLTPGASGFAGKEASAYAPRQRTDAFAMITKAPPAAPFVQRWSVWGAGFGGAQSTNGNLAAGSNDTTSRIAGTAVGADYLFSPNTLAGFALAGGGTNFSVNGFGSGRSDLFQVGAYIRHIEGPAYISAALSYGWQDITTDRYVTVAGLDHLRAEYNANAYSGRVEGGYGFVGPLIGGIGLTPYAAAQFSTFDLPAYAEQVISGSSAFALAYASKSVTNPRTELGLRSDKSFALQDSVLTLRGRIAWAHDFNPDRSIGATFQALPGASFVVNGAAQASDSALTTASAEMKWLNGWSTAATFEGEFSNVTRSYAGKGVVRYAW